MKKCLEKGRVCDYYLLFKIDIATMSHGLEARSPLLDHHLVEYVAGLPSKLKLKGLKRGVGKK